MKFLRLFLLPFSLVYGFGVWIRNFLFDKKLLKSVSFKTSVIAVGNLTVGGSGKTPHVEYIVRLLKQTYRVCTLSRGYGRKTSGFMIVSNPSNTAMVGDEPMQYYHKFPEVVVAVGENRVAAIENLLQLEHKPEVIVMDDAYQHRSVRPGINILLTEYDSVGRSDYLLPAGRLREWKSGAKRADLIIVTKSPPILVPIERKRITEMIRLRPGQQLLFSYLVYDEIVRFNSRQGQMLMGTNYYFEKRFTILLVTGIANPAGITDYLKRRTDKLETILYPDHHEFTAADIQHITETFNNIANASKIIITTEKDAMRLRNPGIEDLIRNLPFFYLPVRVAFHQQDQELFDQLILKYVRENKTNRYVYKR